MSEITRRELLQIGAAAALNRVQPGAGASQRLGVKSELYSRSQIELYTGSLSVEPGDTVTLHVSTIAKKYSLRAVRVGLAESTVWSKGDLPGRFFRTPDDAWEKGCGWPVAELFTIPKDWRSGFYLILAATADRDSPREVAYAFLVVRATLPKNKILLVHATATYGAYNDYGGASLYVKRGNVPNKGFFLGGERRVSFLRPWMPGFLWKPSDYDPAVMYADLDDRGISKKSGVSGWSFAAGFHNWDRVLICWLEKNGYSVDHAISSDLEFHPELLGQYHLMLSVGHDEYWSRAMRDTVESFVAKGGNVCFLSGNVSVWQIRHEDQGNTVVCYKDAPEEDPILKLGQGHLATTLWSSSVVRRPESSLTGLSAFYAGYAGFDGVSPQGAGGYLVYRPEHWALSDTGLRYGDCLGKASSIVNFEVDGCPIRMEDNLPHPEKSYEGPLSLEILGLCPAALPAFNSQNLAVARRLLGNTSAAKALARNRGNAVMGVFTNGGTVFCAGTTDWSSGLTGNDPAVEQVTRNLLNRLGA